MILLVDSREQHPLEFTVDHILTEVVVETLPVGDYACQYVSGHRPPIVFERKSLGDLFGTMTSGYRRFKRELTKAADLKIHLLLGIEASISQVKHGYPHSNFSGDSCLQKVMTLWMRYGLQPVFCRDREELAWFIRATFESIGRVTQCGSTNRRVT